jgi:23S rRNA (guanine2535-N1)-methyltransferase
MPYEYARDRENYEIFAGGGVLYSLPGHTAFPVRLANEIFNRCIALWDPEGQSDPCTLYDPCCGGAYHLTTLAYLNWKRIKRIFASDIDKDALALAGRNLSLLSIDGLDRRIAELSVLVQQFGKSSHAASLGDATNLRQRQLEIAKDHAIETHLFRADATERAQVLTGIGNVKIDIVITDVPYGQRSHWHSDRQATAPAIDPIYLMLESLSTVLSSRAVVAVAATKRDSIAHPRYQRLRKFKLGKRQVAFLKLAD